ncbi:MAG: NAD(P)H-dependent oxidoreductase subunit E [Candidatus Omnitrophica bacterium]|nr:NAD(P)H-dependent oxidoreductase subunit E [Candidatus Omnitrophota bacterium]
MKTILIVGHGSREAAANQEFQTLVEHFRASVVGAQVRGCYVELAFPSLAEALDEAARASNEIVLVPLFLFAAKHVKNDLPLAVSAAKKKFPHVEITVSPALGADPLMMRLLAKRVDASTVAMKSREKTILVVLGRGSSDPDANGDFAKLTRMYTESAGFARVETAFAGVSHPFLEETLNRIALERPDAILIQPYLLFPGTLVGKMEKTVEQFSKLYPWIPVTISQCLGEDPILFDLLQERAGAAETRSVELSCVSCQYRVPMPGFEDEAGGLKALLWSVRHSLTHTQAMPHTHAHKPVKKHVLVCGNVDCVDQGSIAFMETLKRLVKREGLEKQIKVTKTSCLGSCGEGPTVAVYPDGIWYRRCTESYAEELVKNHLVNNELVREIVDHIM